MTRKEEALSKVEKIQKSSARAVVKYVSCSLSMTTSLETPEHVPQAVNNHCFTVLEERGGDNVLCQDNAVPYSRRLLLMHETNGMGALPWSHPNEGVCHEVK